MDITAHRIRDPYWWTVSFNRIEFGDELKMKPSLRSGIVDTGTSMIMGYYEDIDDIQRAQCNFINSNIPASCYNSLPGEVYVDNCTDENLSKMPPLKFQIDSHVYVTRPKQYFLQQEMDGQFFCTSTLVGTQEPEWILGSPFLNDYYQIYDMKRNQVGLVPSIYA